MEVVSLRAPRRRTKQLTVYNPNATLTWRTTAGNRVLVTKGDGIIDTTFTGSDTASSGSPSKRSDPMLLVEIPSPSSPHQITPPFINDYPFGFWI
jgi:hypothetical protein